MKIKVAVECCGIDHGAPDEISGVVAAAIESQVNRRSNQHPCKAGIAAQSERSDRRRAEHNKIGSVAGLIDDAVPADGN